MLDVDVDVRRKCRH